jgi:D-alanyl-D-alanine carboxypeptidase
VKLNGWQSQNGVWYYYENSGSANAYKTTGWKEISGSWYYFGSDGAMYQNTVTPDGYAVDSNGVWIK